MTKMLQKCVHLTYFVTTECTSRTKLPPESNHGSYYSAKFIFPDFSDFPGQNESFCPTILFTWNTNVCFQKPQTTCLQNLEMSGNFTDVRISAKITELSVVKCCQWKLPKNFP